MKQRGNLTDGSFAVLLIIVCIALVGLVAGLHTQEAEEWEQFRVKNECKIVAQMNGSTSFVNTISFDSKGNQIVGLVPVTIPDKTGWHCSDGITYWRTK